jgi:hypothetical protein
MSITQLKKLRRAELGLCVKCGHKPCNCKTSRFLPPRESGKRGKRGTGHAGETEKVCSSCKVNMVWKGGRETCPKCGAYIYRQG